MKVRVDGGEWACEIGEEDTVGTVLERCVDELARRKRWIVSAVLDGEKIPAQKDSPLRSRPCSGCGALELTTRPAAEIVLPLVDAVIMRLADLRRVHVEAGEAVALGRGPTGLRNVVQCLLGWKAMVEFLTHLSRTAAHPGMGVRIPAEEWNERIRALNGSLVELKDALERKDVSLAGDLLAHDLVEHLDAWERMLREWRPQAEKQLRPPPEP